MLITNSLNYLCIVAYESAIDDESHILIVANKCICHINHQGWLMGFHNPLQGSRVDVGCLKLTVNHLAQHTHLGALSATIVYGLPMPSSLPTIAQVMVLKMISPVVWLAKRSFIKQLPEIYIRLIQIPARILAEDGSNGDNPAAIKSAFTNTGQWASWGKNSLAKVVLPAPLGPAMITIFGLVIVRILSEL